MGLIKCPKCEKEIRSSVKNCPYCECEIKHPQSKIKKMLPYIIAAIISIIIFGMFKTYLDNQTGKISNESKRDIEENLKKEIGKITETAVKEIEEAEEPEVVKTQDYAIDADNYINFTVNNTDDGPAFMVYININDNEKASLAFAQYYAYLSKDDVKQYNPSICVICNDLMAIWSCRNGYINIAGTNSDGTYVSSLPNWIISDIEDITMGEGEQAEFVKLLTGFVSDFVEQ